MNPMGWLLILAGLGTGVGGYILARRRRKVHPVGATFITTSIKVRSGGTFFSETDPWRARARRREAVEWTIAHDDLLPARSVVELRFAGASPVNAHKPRGRKRIVDRVLPQAERRPHSYKVWLVLEDGTDHEMEDPELEIAI